MNRIEAESFMRALTGQTAPNIGDTILFTKKGWRYRAVEETTEGDPLTDYYTKDEIDDLLENKLTYIETTVTWNVGTIPSGDWVYEEFEVLGAEVGDAIFASNEWQGEISTDQVILTYKVIAADTVRLAIYNATGSGYNPGESSVKIVVAKI